MLHEICITWQLGSDVIEIPKSKKKEKERLPLRLWVGLMQYVEGLLSKI